MAGALLPRGAVAQAPPRDGETRIIGSIRVAGAVPPRNVVVRGDGAARAALTDSLGRFSLTMRSGRTTLHLRAVGLVALDTTLELAGGTLELSLALSKVIAVLDTTRVVETGSKPARYAATTRFDAFYERKSRAVGGAFITREDIERSAASDAADILRAVPGAKVERTRTGTPVVRFPRCAGVAGIRSSDRADGTGPSAVVQVFIDGVRVQEPFVALGSLSAADIEAMEVYRSSAELPPEARGDGCAAIMIWTRYTAGAAGAPPAPTP